MKIIRNIVRKEEILGSNRSNSFKKLGLQDNYLISKSLSFPKYL